MAKWDDQFVNQCNVRRAVILHGNVQDAFFDGGSTEGVPIVEFLRLCVPMLRVKEVVMPGTADFDSLVDSLEGFTYRDMQQLVKMSRVEAEPLSYRRLIQLYKLGERKSPWEDLNRRRLTGLDDELKKSVKGQDHVIEKVTRVIKRAYLGLSGLQHSAK